MWIKNLQDRGDEVIKERGRKEPIEIKISGSELATPLADDNSKVFVKAPGEMVGDQYKKEGNLRYK